MAVVAQEQITPEAPRPARTTRRRVAAWPSPSQLRQSVPILRLLAEIWAIPQVTKVAVLVDGIASYVRVILPDIDREAQSRIYDAERRYLTATSIHAFQLQVVPLSKAPVAVPPEFEVVLER